MELDQITVMYIPAHYVSSLAVTCSGTILTAVMDFSISEDPYLRLNFVPSDSDELKAEIEDSKQVQPRDGWRSAAGFNALSEETRAKGSEVRCGLAKYF